MNKVGYFKRKLSYIAVDVQLVQISSGSPEFTENDATVHVIHGLTNQDYARCRWQEWRSGRWPQPPDRDAMGAFSVDSSSSLLFLIAVFELLQKKVLVGRSLFPTRRIAMEDGFWLCRPPVKFSYRYVG